MCESAQLTIFYCIDFGGRLRIAHHREPVASRVFDEGGEYPVATDNGGKLPGCRQVGDVLRAVILHQHGQLIAGPHMSIHVAVQGTGEAPGCGTIGIHHTEEAEVIHQEVGFGGRLHPGQLLSIFTPPRVVV